MTGPKVICCGTVKTVPYRYTIILIARGQKTTHHHPFKLFKKQKHPTLATEGKIYGYCKMFPSLFAFRANRDDKIRTNQHTNTIATQFRNLPFAILKSQRSSEPLHSSLFTLN